MCETGLFWNESVAWNLFEDTTFRAFVLEFYYEQEDRSDWTWWDVMRHIFWDSDMYRRFVKHCREHNYWFLSEDERINYNIQVCLLIFEQAQQLIVNGTLEKLRDILDINLWSVEYQNVAKIIPWTHTSYWVWLQASIHAGIPSNTQWQIVYTVWKIGELYHVYSHELGLHYIDSQGNIRELWTLNAKRRVRLKRQIHEFELVLKLVNEGKTEENKKLVWGLARLFEIDSGMKWNENNLSRLRFRSWLWEKIIEMEQDFDSLIQEDTRTPVLYVAYSWD